MKYWNSTLKKMKEYIPGEQPDDIDQYIKLNTNENAFPPSKDVTEAIIKDSTDALRRYPNPNCDSVREEFAAQNNISKENIFVGNGSDEVFTLIFRGFLDKKDSVAFAYPSYSLYYTMAEANGIKYEKIDLNDNFDIPFDKFLNDKYKMVILCNPNNPTGKGIEKAKIKNFLENFKGLVVVDEAYVDFYQETVIQLIKKYDNLIVTRSFSKSYSLAGLRVGMAIANEDIIKGFLKLKDSYNVDRLACSGALAALKDNKTFNYNIKMLLNNKEYLEGTLKELNFKIVPSKANFLFVKHKTISSKDLYEKLKEKKILIRYFEGPIQSEYIRITVGTMMELKALIKEIREILD